MYSNEYDDLQDDLLQRSAEVIDDIIGKAATENQKQELLDSISFILEKNTNKLLSNLKRRNTANYFTPRPNNFPNSDKSAPCINLILAVPNAYPQYPPQFNNQAIPNAYPPNTRQNQAQMATPTQPYQPIQPIQQPLFPFYNQLQLMNPIPLAKKKHSKKDKNKKNKKKHHHKKSSKSTKHSEPSKEVKSDFNIEVGTFSFRSSDSFCGVISYLKSQGPIESLIAITSSSQEQPSNFAPIEAIGHGNGNRYFKSRSESNSWICLDFKDYRISPTKYTVGTTNNAYKLKSWAIEGSNDNISWKLLDQENNCMFTKTTNAVFVFSTSNSQTEKFRYIRLRMTGPNWSGNLHLRLNSFEIYGKLFK